MSWVRLDDGFADKPEMVSAGATAFALAIWALCHSSRHLTDGHIPRRSLSGCTWVAEKSQRSRACGRLEVAGFWARVDDGYQILDPFAYLQKSEDVIEKRAANAARQARWRQGKKAARNGSSNGVTRIPRNAPPYPDPEGVRGDAAIAASTPAATRPATPRRHSRVCPLCLTEYKATTDEHLAHVERHNLDFPLELVIPTVVKTAAPGLRPACFVCRRNDVERLIVDDPDDGRIAMCRACLVDLGDVRRQIECDACGERTLATWIADRGNLWLCDTHLELLKTDADQVFDLYERRSAA